jgi:hypothetical protein
MENRLYQARNIATLTRSKYHTGPHNNQMTDRRISVLPAQMDFLSSQLGTPYALTGTDNEDSSFVTSEGP